MNHVIDSKIANNGEWKNFVRHRVNEILKLTKEEEWGHVPGVENPADIGSRGAKASELRDSKLWWEGPKWLREEKETWPNNEPLEDLNEVSEERKKAIVLTTSVAEKESESVSKVIDINRFSKLGKLLRVTSYVKRFIDNLKKKRAGIGMTLEKVSVEELKSAEKDWIKDVQTTLHGKSDFERSKVQLGIVMHNGDVVLIYDANEKRGFWKPGIVQDIIVGKDGVVRGASVRKMGRGKPETLNRPLQKLFPLEIACRDHEIRGGKDECQSKKGMHEKSNEKNEKGQKTSLDRVKGQKNRTPRAAAIDARCKMQAMLDP